MCTAAAFAQQIIKKIFKKSSIWMRSEGLGMDRLTMWKEKNTK
jgi:hypothetical protein